MHLCVCATPVRHRDGFVSIESELWSYIVVIVVVTLTHRYNAVRGHRTGSNNSGVEDYLIGTAVLLMYIHQ